jgi:DNA-binding MarR family transcriptional regulator
MHRVVGLLERAGQVGRRSHPAHGRIQEIAITRRGRSSVAKARKLVASVEDEVFAGASDRDVKVVRRVLRNALEAIEAA